MKYAKLEKERNDYKHAADRLENKLAELTADLTEEHSTSTHATEMLENEQAERMKLEKDLKEIQVRMLQKYLYIQGIICSLRLQK